jgi:hypothetical protein
VQKFISSSWKNTTTKKHQKKRRWRWKRKREAKRAIVFQRSIELFFLASTPAKWWCIHFCLQRLEVELWNTLATDSSE